MRLASLSPHPLGRTGLPAAQLRTQKRLGLTWCPGGSRQDTQLGRSGCSKFLSGLHLIPGVTRGSRMSRTCGYMDLYRITFDFFNWFFCRFVSLIICCYCHYVYARLILVVNHSLSWGGRPEDHACLYCFYSENNQTLNKDMTTPELKINYYFFSLPLHI